MVGCERAPRKRLMLQRGGLKPARIAAALVVMAALLVVFGGGRT
jgi:hypothetical protein